MADRFLAAAYLFLLTAALVSGASAGTGPPDVLVIYDSGLPSKTISEVTAADNDVMAGPTPKVTNCRTVAQELAATLESRGLVVRVVEASAVENPKVQARVIVLGSPARFWNVSWRMKKFFDEQFGRIYISSKQEFATLRVAAFAMAEIEPSAAAALKAIESRLWRQAPSHNDYPHHTPSG